MVWTRNHVVEGHVTEETLPNAAGACCYAQDGDHTVNVHEFTERCILVKFSCAPKGRSCSLHVIHV